MNARDEEPRRPPATPSARRREAEAHAVEWAAHNLGVHDIEELRAQGVQVYAAPKVDVDVKVVSLADGRVDTFHASERRPQRGYYVAYERLQRHCLERGLALQEVDGVISLLPHGSGEAGDPLGHIGR